MVTYCLRPLRRLFILIHPHDTINDNERLIYSRIISSPGISAVDLANVFGKSIITTKRALKHLVDLNLIEYRGPKKTGGYYSM